MIILEKEMIDSIKGIIYFKNEKNQIYATLNTYSNLYSYTEDLSKGTQDVFNDLADDTKNEEDVFIYSVKEELMNSVDELLSSNNFKRVYRYDWIEEDDIVLEKEMINSINGIVYFKNEKNKIYATLNTFSNLYSYMEDLSQGAQDLFNDLSNDTKNDEDVFIYFVKEELINSVDEFLSSNNFKRVNRYDWIEEDE